MFVYGHDTCMYIHMFIYKYVYDQLSEYGVGFYL